MCVIAFARYGSVDKCDCHSCVSVQSRLSITIRFTGSIYLNAFDLLFCFNRPSCLQSGFVAPSPSVIAICGCGSVHSNAFDFGA